MTRTMFQRISQFTKWVPAKIEAAGTRCLLIAGDVGDEKFCQRTVKKVVKGLGGLHVLMNNAAEQHVQEEGLPTISSKQTHAFFLSDSIIFFQTSISSLCLADVMHGCVSRRSLVIRV